MAGAILSLSFSCFAAPSAATQAFVAKAEAMALKALPPDKLNEAAGFFGPVSKRHMPSFRRFCAEYQAAQEKLPVVARYLPEAEQAFAEAKAIKVPPKYEKQKQDYLKMIGGFLGMVRMSLQVSAFAARMNSKGKTTK